MDQQSLTGKYWRVRGEKTAGESLFDAFCRVRAFDGDFLKEGDYKDLTDPNAIPGIKEATERILRALKNKEKVLVFGDFDLDGMSGSAILDLAFHALGLHVTTRLPGRTDGYGLSKSVYDRAKTEGISLVITVDCGCNNSQEIAYGNTLGIDTIVTDHHTLPKTLPAAVAVAHPHRGDPADATWDLTGAGVAFFLALALFKKSFPGRAIDTIISKLSELAILGTIADVGKLTGQNRVLAQYGLKQLRRTKHPGLLSLLNAAKIPPAEVTAESIAFYLAPRLNAAGRVAHPEWALQLLIGDPRYVEQYSFHLETFNHERRALTDRFFELAESEISGIDAPFYAVHHEEFSPGIAGLIAARLQEKYGRPAIALSKTEDADILTASCRGPEDFHLAEALKEVSHLLLKHGGHRCAAGFSMRKEHLRRFKEEFAEIVTKKRGEVPPVQELLADLEAEGEDFLQPDFYDIFKAAPFGAGNPEPLFWIRNVGFSGVRPVGKNGDHLIGDITTKKRPLPFVAFRMASFLPPASWNQRFDVLVNTEFKTWNGKKTVKLKVADVRETE